jgi:CheY-like chemotaxis protein
MAELGLLNKCVFKNDGQEVIDFVKIMLKQHYEGKQPICALLLDYQMPKKNGLQVVEEVFRLYAERNDGLNKAD